MSDSDFVKFVASHLSDMFVDDMSTNERRIVTELVKMGRLRIEDDGDTQETRLVA